MAKNTVKQKNKLKKKQPSKTIKDMAQATPFVDTGSSSKISKEVKIASDSTIAAAPVPITSAAKSLLESASLLLSFATGIAILFGLAMAFLPGGNDAVPAMGGVLQATAPELTAKLVFMLDILFPITFGAGFALLATAFQSRGNRPLVRMILTVLLFVVLADFSENALVFKALTGGETYAVQWPLTVIKYAMLGLSAILLSSIILVRGTLGTVVQIFLRYVFPFSVAALVAGIGGRVGGDIVGATFPLGLLLLAVYANSLSSET